MRIWVNISDAAGNIKGDGPLINVRSVRVSRALDGAGYISVTAPGTDERTLDLLVPEARAAIYAHLGGSNRLLGTGIIKKRELSEGTGGITITAEGPDGLHELKYTNTLLARMYNNKPIATVVNSLVSLVSGWSVTTDSGLGNISARFDGASALKALQEIAEQNGLHFRLGSSAKTLVFGALGTDSGLYIFNRQQAHADLYSNDDIALVENIQLVDDTESVINWVVPLGAGEGEAALTLEKSTRTSPKTIQTTTGPDGRTIYYLSDATSIATYGTIQQVALFKQIAPLSNSATDIENAANALYDATVEYLERHSVAQQAFSVRVKKAWANTINPGDKVHVTYKGFVFRDGDRIDYVDIDDDYWVLKATETVGVGGHTVSLHLSNIDRVMQNAVDVIVGAIESIELRNIKPQTYPTLPVYVYTRQIDSSHHAIIPIRITNATTYLHRAQLRLTTRPFRTTASAASSGGGSTSGSGGGTTATTASGGGTTATTAGGGDHRHMMFSNDSASGPYTSLNNLAFHCKDDQAGTNNVHVNLEAPATGLFTEDASGTHTHSVTVPSHSHSVTIPNHTHTTPNHTHSITYAINDDTDYPDHIKIYINGIDRTFALTGSSTLDDSGSGLDQVVEISAYLNGASGGLWQNHEVKITCTGGQGEIEAEVELFMTTQSIAVT